MVGPSLSDDERRSASLRLKLFITSLVGISAALIAFQAQATPLQIAVAFVAGLALGVVLVVYLVRITKLPEIRRPPR